MSHEKRPRLTLEQPDAGAGDKAAETPRAIPKNPGLPPDLPHEACRALCCRRGKHWFWYQFALNEYWNGPSHESLDTWGRWKALHGGVSGRATSIQALGLAPWDELEPRTRERLKTWSPVAKQLWESDFIGHRQAIVRAWIWHYLDDNFFSFSGGDALPDTLVQFSSPIWEHVRALRRDLDVLRTRHNDEHDSYYRTQFHAWSRITEHLVRRGLGLDELATPAYLVAHFKQSLRQLLTDGEAQLPDHAIDAEWHLWPDVLNMMECLHLDIKHLVQDALTVQYYIHGLRFGSYTIRFTPIRNNDLWGFPFDKEWMRLQNPMEIPEKRPGEELPAVQLVSDPMLVVSGLDGISHDKEFTQWTPMVVVTPWTFGGDEGNKYTFPGFEKGYQERARQEMRKKIDAEKLAQEAQLAEEAKRAGECEETEEGDGAEACEEPEGRDELEGGDVSDYSEDGSDWQDNDGSEWEDED